MNQFPTGNSELHAIPTWKQWRVGQHQEFTLPQGQSYRAFVPEPLSTELLDDLTAAVATHLSEQQPAVLEELQALSTQLRALASCSSELYHGMWQAQLQSARARASAALEGYRISLAAWLDWKHFPQHASPDRELMILRAQLTQAQAQGMASQAQALRKQMRLLRQRHQVNLQQVSQGLEAQQWLDIQLNQSCSPRSCELEGTQVVSTTMPGQSTVPVVLSNQLLQHTHARLLGIFAPDTDVFAQGEDASVHSERQAEQVKSKDLQPALPWRTEQNFIGIQDWRHAIFVPPPPQLVAQLMNNLEAFYQLVGCEHGTSTSELTRKNAPLTQEIFLLGPVVQMALVHYQLLTIHPWSDGNGRMARILLGQQLEQWGGVATRWINLERELLMQRSEYYQYLHAARKGELGAWVVFFIELLLKAGRRGIAELAQVRTYRQEVTSKLTTLYHERQLHALLAIWDVVSSELVVSIPLVVRALGWRRDQVVSGMNLLLKHQIISAYSSNPAIKTTRYVEHELFNLWR